MTADSPGYAVRLASRLGALVAFGLTGCTEPVASDDNISAATGERPAVLRWKLPKELREVSGLAVDSDGRVYAVADERAAVYRIEPVSGKIDSVYGLGKPTLAGDFEGIALADDWLYLVTSSGKLVRTRGAEDGKSAAYEAFDLSLIHISEPTRLRRISYAVFCLKKKKA